MYIKYLKNQSSKKLVKIIFSYVFCTVATTFQKICQIFVVIFFEANVLDLPFVL